MTLVKIDLGIYKDTALGWRAQKGVELSHWCRTQGLNLGIDYEWRFQHEINQLWFSFQDPAWASLFALKWVDRS